MENLIIGSSPEIKIHIKRKKERNKLNFNFYKYAINKKIITIELLNNNKKINLTIFEQNEKKYIINQIFLEY